MLILGKGKKFYYQYITFYVYKTKSLLGIFYIIKKNVNI